MILDVRRYSPALLCVLCTACAPAAAPDSSDKSAPVAASSQAQALARGDDKASAAQTEHTADQLASEAAQVSSPFTLTDVTELSGIEFKHYYDGHGQRYIIEAVAGGIASFDYDLDGRVDIYFTNGADLPSGQTSVAALDDSQQPPVAGANALYRNLGEWKFHDAAAASLTDDTSFSMGAVAADFDNDGFVDLFVNNFGPNRLYRNNGDGTFSDVTQSAAVAGQDQLGAGACFVDIDGDGLLDLYVGNYVKSPIEENRTRTVDGFPSYPGPLDFEPESDFLYSNLGDGTFSDISVRSGISALATTSMGIIAADLDNDGDADIVVVNDVERNLFFENDGSGNLSEVGIQRGIAFSGDGNRNGNMGIDSADFNGDGWLDLFTTTFSNDLPVLYRNDGHGNFADVTHATGAGSGMFPHANWGTAFVDLDLDGKLDLFIANGHTDPNVHRWAFSTHWKVANTVLHNVGGTQFKDVSAHSGSGLAPVESSRGVAAEDFDNDGDVDLIVLNALAAPTLIRNDSEAHNHWLQVVLTGRTACRDGTGGRVIVESKSGVAHAEVRSGGGYQSSFGRRLTFGLGDADRVDRLTVRWSDGSQQTLEQVEADQCLHIVQTTEAD